MLVERIDDAFMNSKLQLNSLFGCLKIEYEMNI